MQVKLAMARRTHIHTHTHCMQIQRVVGANKHMRRHMASQGRSQPPPPPRVMAIPGEREHHITFVSPTGQELRGVLHIARGSYVRLTSLSVS